MNLGIPWCAVAGFLLGFALLAVGVLTSFAEIMAPDGVRLWMLAPALLPGVLTWVWRF